MIVYFYGANSQTYLRLPPLIFTPRYPCMWHCSSANVHTAQHGANTVAGCWCAILTYMWDTPLAIFNRSSPQSAQTQSAPPSMCMYAKPTKKSSLLADFLYSVCARLACVQTHCFRDRRSVCVQQPNSKREPKAIVCMTTGMAITSTSEFHGRWHEATRSKT